jgi:hypothetical protein
LTKLGLTRESEVAENLYQDSNYVKTELLPSSATTKFMVTDPVLGKKPLIIKLHDLFPLFTREVFFDMICRSRLPIMANRPFVRVWRLRGK